MNPAGEEDSDTDSRQKAEHVRDVDGELMAKAAKRLRHVFEGCADGESMIGKLPMKSLLIDNLHIRRF